MEALTVKLLDSGSRGESRQREAPGRYRVLCKKVVHKREEKMQEKIKMTLQKDNNLAQEQPQCSVYFCTKQFLNHDFFG